MLFTILLYIIAVIFLVWSFTKDKGKTKKALMIARKAFFNIFPEFSAILILIGIMLTLLSPQVISRLIGGQSGVLGMFISSVIGSITLIPGFIAFPLAKSLLDYGAGIMQVAVFISTLMMVGVVTAPLEMKYFGRKEMLLRNSMAYFYSFLVAGLLGVVLR